MDSRIRKPGQAYLQHRHAILFYSLLVSLVASPLLAALSLGDQWLEYFLAVNLVVAVIGGGGNVHRRFLLTLVTGIVLARLLAIKFHANNVSSALLALWIVIGLTAAAHMLRYALRASEVDAEHIYAALSAYLLAGLLWGALYWIVEHAWPGSFPVPSENEGFSLFQAVYFSFVTLATLGYGDIVPKQDVARGLVIVEAIAGQLYLAVMISRLISSYVRSAIKDRE